MWTQTEAKSAKQNNILWTQTLVWRREAILNRHKRNRVWKVMTKVLKSTQLFRLRLKVKKGIDARKLRFRSEQICYIWYKVHSKVFPEIQHLCEIRICTQSPSESGDLFFIGISYAWSKLTFIQSWAVAQSTSKWMNYLYLEFPKNPSLFRMCLNRKGTLMQKSVNWNKCSCQCLDSPKKGNNFKEK